jgi:hypothetical protein
MSPGTPVFPKAAPRVSMREDGRDIRTVQDLLGHRDVTTPQMYTHVLNRGPYRLRRPGPARRAGISSVPGQT